MPWIGRRLRGELRSFGGFSHALPRWFEPVETNIDQNNTNSSGGSTTTGAGEGVGELGSAVEFEEFDDTRNQGFVGVTADRIQESGFIGRSVLLGSPLAEGASFGGGVNNVDSNQGNIGNNEFNNFEFFQFLDKS